MPTKNPRVNVVLEKPLFESLNKIARSDGVSLSMKIRELVKEGIELREDTALDRLAEKRLKTFDKKRALKHADLF